MYSKFKMVMSASILAGKTLLKKDGSAVSADEVMLKKDIIALYVILTKLRIRSGDLLMFYLKFRSRQSFSLFLYLS